MMEEEMMEEEGRVELIDDEGETHVFYHLGTMEYQGELYAFFEPEETVDNEEEGEVSIFRLGGEDSNELYPIEDDSLMEELFAEFSAKLEEEEAAEEAGSLDA
ncbi:MAG: DUF1292 domain-containing protein [Clostridia bacterium]|nr:DUF1292 domain-containing protein [Clostridia bacterium]